MKNKNKILFSDNNKTNQKERKQSSLRLYKSNDKLNKAINQTIKFKLNNFNNSNSSEIIKYKQIKLKRKQKKNKTFKLSFSKNSQTNLKNYLYKFRNDLFNYSFCNSNIINSKIKVSHSSKEINRNKYFFKIFEDNPKTKLLSEKKVYKVLYKNNNNYNHRYIFDKKNINNNTNIKNNEYNPINNYINNYEIIDNLINQNKDNNQKSDINTLNIFNAYSYNFKKKEKFINLKNNISYMKYNNIFPRKSIINLKLKEKKSNWKNNILEGIITNITKINKKPNDLSFYDENYNHYNIKMFTILDLYNKNHKGLKSL